MKRVVLYIDSLKLGGAERVTLTWANWLVESGWKVCVLTRKPMSWDFYPIPDGVERYVETPDRFWLRFLGPLGFPFRVLKLRHWLKKNQINLAIGITSLPSVKLLFATHYLDLQCIVSERNYPPLKHIGLIWNFLRRVSYRWSALHIVQTQQVGHWLRDQLSITSQLQLANPVQWPLPRFSPELLPEIWLEDQHVQPNHPLILAVGTKMNQKGFDRLVDWFLPLGQRHSTLQLVIIGIEDVPYHGINQQAELKSRLNAFRDIQKRLHFPGRVGNIEDWYHRATLFVLSSRYEGFPNVLLEAMASGCCCIASDCPQGPSELIRPGKNGVLMSRDASNHEWVSQLDSLLNNQTERQKLAKNAIQVRHDYAPHALKQTFLTAVNGVMSTGKNRGT